MNQRIEKLRSLFLQFSNESAFTIQEHANKSETKLTDAMWNEQKVVLHYLPIICTSASELEEEFRLAWPVLCKLWMEECERCRGKKPQQVNIFTNFLLGPDSAIQYPQVCQFIKILIAAPSNTSCVEQGYSSLEMICVPLRNWLMPEHLETLFLLATLTIPVKKQMNMALKPSYWKICWGIRHFSRCCSLFFIQYLGCLLPFQFNPPIDSSKNSYLEPCTEHSLTVAMSWLIIMWSIFFIYLSCFFSAVQHPQASILILL